MVRHAGLSLKLLGIGKIRGSGGKDLPCRWVCWGFCGWFLLWKGGWCFSFFGFCKFGGGGVLEK